MEFKSDINFLNNENYSFIHSVIEDNNILTKSFNDYKIPSIKVDGDYKHFGECKDEPIRTITNILTPVPDLEDDICDINDEQINKKGEFSHANSTKIYTSEFLIHNWKNAIKKFIIKKKEEIYAESYKIKLTNDIHMISSIYIYLILDDNIS